MLIIDLFLMFCCPEIYNSVVTANDDCPLCNPSSASTTKTNSLNRHNEEQVCPRCRHTLSDSVAVDELAHHSYCSAADNTVSFFAIVPF